MEVKPGYKETDAGVLPEDWDLHFLSSFVTKGPKNGYSGRSSKDARGTPTLSLGATTSGALVLNDETVKRLDETIDAKSDLFLQSGDVLVQRSNTIDLVGTAAVFDGPSNLFVYPDLMMRMRFGEKATADWFWRYANSANGRRFFIGVAAGSSGSMPKISGDKLRRMPLPVPPLPERRLIATALSDVDHLIGALDSLIVKKRDLTQAVIQQLLTGRTRLPGFAPLGSKLKHTDAGMIPEDWNYDYIENFADITTGSKNTQDRIEDGKYPFFVRSQVVERIDSYSFDGEAVLTAGDGVGTGKVFHYMKGKFDVHQRVYRISDFTDKVNGYFFYLYFSTHFFSRIMQMTAKSSVDSVRRDMIARMLVALPSTAAEQAAIAQVLKDMDAELRGLEQRREKSRALKQAMTQELLTGKTRLIPAGAAPA